MIKIRKGTQIIEVPTGAFKSFYKTAGWTEFKEVKQESSLEKEIRSMSNDELKRFAKERGIKTAGISKKALIETLLADE